MNRKDVPLMSTQAKLIALNVTEDVQHQILELERQKYEDTNEQLSDDAIAKALELSYAHEHRMRKLELAHKPKDAWTKAAEVGGAILAMVIFVAPMVLIGCLEARTKN